MEGNMPEKIEELEKENQELKDKIVDLESEVEELKNEEAVSVNATEAAVAGLL